MPAGDGFQVEGLDHVEFLVPDQAEAARWYADRLGFEVVPEFAGWATGGPLMLAVDGGRSKLALFAGEPPRAAAPVGFRRVAFRVGGAAFLLFVSRIADHPVCDNTGRDLRHLDIVEHGLAYSVYFCDPWGHALEVTTYEVDHVRGA